MKSISLMLPFNVYELWTCCRSEAESLLLLLIPLVSLNWMGQPYYRVEITI